jgi:hypothetical protein
MEHPDQYGPINTPIKDTKLGLGVSIINDRIGPSDENNLAVDFSYYINTSEDFNSPLD